MLCTVLFFGKKVRFSMITWRAMYKRVCLMPQTQWVLYKRIRLLAKTQWVTRKKIRFWQKSVGFYLLEFTF